MERLGCFSLLCDPLFTAVHETLDVGRRTCFLIKVMSPCITIYDMRHRETSVHVQAQYYKLTLLDRLKICFADSCVRQHKCGNITLFATILSSIYWLVEAHDQGLLAVSELPSCIGMKHMEHGCFLLCIWVVQCA